jgi:subtilisin family serine protease
LRTTTAGSVEQSRMAWRLTALAAATVLAATMLAPVTAEAADDRGTARFIVTTDPAGHASERDLRDRGAEDVRTLQYTPDALVVVASPRAAERIAKARGVTAIELDHVMSVQHHRDDHCGGPRNQQLPHCNDDPGDDPGDEPAEPGDPEDPADPTQVTPWGVSHIGAPDAWQTSTGAGAKVCVADTGIDKTHETLDYVAGENFHTSHPRGHNLDPKAYGDRNGHGTHVAGTVAARNNGLGVVGVAPEADLLVAKVLGDNGSGSISQIVEGLNWCQREGADVINMSFAGGYSATLQTTVTDIAAKGVVLVAATGNQGNTSASYPAGYAEVIGVGATDDQDVVAGFSNRGEELNAPGVQVLSSVPGDAYEKWNGTSMASPHVAGVAALLVGEHDAAGVRSTLTSTAESIGDDALRVDAADAVGG